VNAAQHSAGRAAAAAIVLAVMMAGSTAPSSLFVSYRDAWGLTSADIAIVFTAYVGTLLPMLLLFGTLAERFGRRPVAAAGVTAMAAGLLTLTLAHGFALLVVARLLQGIGVGIAIGAISAAFVDAYRGPLPQGSALQSVTSVGLFCGPVISAAAFNLGAGLDGSFVPGLTLAVVALGLTPFLVAGANGRVAAPDEEPLPAAVVRRALRFALPLSFISWAGLSLYLSLVPAYLATALHAHNPAIGAAAIVAAQGSSLAATLLIGAARLARVTIIAPAAGVLGLMLLIVGTSANLWPLIALATMLVGAGGGLSSAAAFGIAGRIGRGQRSRIFARMYVAGYLGYSVPVLAIGIIGAHATLAAGFITVVAVLALMTAALPALREPRPVPAGAVAAAG
jgi:hypothetical protein